MNPYESPAAVEEHVPASRPWWLAAYVFMVLAYCFLPLTLLAVFFAGFSETIAGFGLCFVCAIVSLALANHAVAVGCREICDRIMRIVKCSS